MVSHLSVLDPGQITLLIDIRAKDLLHSKNISFEEIDVSDDIESLQKMVKLSGQRSVPQIFINNKSIGGFDELSKMNVDGQLVSQ